MPSPPLPLILVILLTSLSGSGVKTSHVDKKNKEIAVQKKVSAKEEEAQKKKEEKEREREREKEEKEREKELKRLEEKRASTLPHLSLCLLTLLSTSHSPPSRSHSPFPSLLHLLLSHPSVLSELEKKRLKREAKGGPSWVDDLADELESDSESATTPSGTPSSLPPLPLLTIRTLPHSLSPLSSLASLHHSSLLITPFSRRQTDRTAGFDAEDPSPDALQRRT